MEKLGCARSHAHFSQLPHGVTNDVAAFAGYFFESAGWRLLSDEVVLSYSGAGIEADGV